MKSQRRHELEQNTLDAELAATWAFLKKHGNRILTVVLVVLAVVVGWVYWNRRAEAARIETRMQYDRLLAESRSGSADEEAVLAGFRGLAAQDDVDWIAANALLQLARMNATRALVLPEADAGQIARQQARDDYQQVVRRFEDSLPLAAATARVGLGKLAEGQGEFEDAREYYKLVAENPDLDGYPVAELARQALSRSSRFGTKVLLPTTQPAWVDAEEDEKPSTTTAPDASAEAETLAPPKPAPTTRPASTDTGIGDEQDTPSPAEQPETTPKKSSEND